MYIKKKDRELFNFIDENVQIPSKWCKFINEQRVYHNLIIKNKSEYYCTNCKHIFKSNLKINDEGQCPNCKKIYTIKSNKLKTYVFKDQLAIFDKVDDYYVERIFQLEDHYDNGSMKTSYCFEWGRRIYDNDFSCLYEIMNDNTVGTTSGYWISYRYISNSNWKYTTSYYSPIAYNNEFIYYPYNLKKLLSKTKYKYSQLWELVKHVGYCDLVYLLKNYNPSIELLTKSKLYKLALCPKSFLNKKDFNERFMGLDKSYIPFIRKYNLDINELEVLSLIKERNISLVKAVSKLNNYRDLFSIINLKKAFNLTNLNMNNCTEYGDYLKMIKMMNFDMKDPKYLYPSNIITAHNNALKEYEVVRDEVICEAIVKRHNVLLANSYSDKKYIVFPVDSIKSLEDESAQQHNCVRTYAEKIAKGNCDIYFMRMANSPNKSLVTIEVRNNEIVQKRTKNNQVTTNEQDKFLDMWEKKVLRSGRRNYIKE